MSLDRVELGYLLLPYVAEWNDKKAYYSSWDSSKVTKRFNNILSWFKNKKGLTAKHNFDNLFLHKK